MRKKTKTNMAAKTESALTKIKLSDEEKSDLITFYRENKVLWSTENQFCRNKEEKCVAKERLSELFDGKYSVEVREKTFHALQTAFNREARKYKEASPKKKVEILR